MLSIDLVTDEGRELLLDADQGNANAQNELGIVCLEQEKPQIALHWFGLAAEQGCADAMHYLSKLYLGDFEYSGEAGIVQNRSQAFVWLSKAALHGHLIAQAQLAVWTED